MIYLNMTIGSAHGWGVCGKYIARELAKLEPLRVIGEPLDLNALGDVLEFHELQRLMLGEYEAASLPKVDGTRVTAGPLLQTIGDETLHPKCADLRGNPTIGYAFFERNLMQPEWVENGRRYFDRIVTGSTWCTRVLLQAGLTNVATVIQGVDPSLFCPANGSAPPRDFLSDRFVVFSGGKFEFRKGQDIVIRAYKVLQDRHRDVLLLNAWFNLWPVTIETMRESKLIRFTPGKGSFVQLINQVLADNDLDLDRVITCPRQPNSAMAKLYRNTDVGIFPNRCEGGTNLVLMEYMASGKPVVAVNTTGHADIVNTANALTVATKAEINIKDENGVPVARWPEPDLDDAIDKLEWAYQNPDKLRPLAEQAAKDLGQRTWQKAAETFQAIIRETSQNPRSKAHQFCSIA